MTEKECLDILNTSLHYEHGPSNALYYVEEALNNYHWGHPTDMESLADFLDKIVTILKTNINE